MNFYIDLLPFFIFIVIGTIQSIIEFLFVKKQKGYSFYNEANEAKYGNRSIYLFRMYLKSEDKNYIKNYRKKVLPFLILTTLSIVCIIIYIFVIFKK